jgi:3-hydroxybutyryl-CoA dehydrogenase
MQLVVLTNKSLKEELLANVDLTIQDITWLEDISQLREHKGADAFIDLLFVKDHISILESLLPKTIIINSVIDTVAETNESFVRINAWPGFLQSATIEASALQQEQKREAENIFSLFNRKIEWLPDQPGFVTPRVISMIINEAFISLREGVSTKEDIDTAMKLGTNYPYGPFEWADKIGIQNIVSLLQKLSKHHARYTPFISS